MTLTLNIRPDVEAALSREAAAHGVEVEKYAAVLQEEAAAHLPPSAAIGNPEAKDMVELFSPLRGLNLDFERDGDAGRDVNL